MGDGLVESEGIRLAGEVMVHNPGWGNRYSGDLRHEYLVGGIYRRVAIGYRI